MPWWSGFADNLSFDVPLATMTWFRVGGCARYLFRPDGVDSLASFLSRTKEESIPVKVLGAGANVLVSDDGFDGVVVRLDHQAFRGTQWLGTTATVGAGVDLMPLVKRCSLEGLTGLECLAGIPATMGGAVRMNAGGKFGDTASVVSAVEVVSAEGQSRRLCKDELRFGYRSSGLDDFVVTSVDIELHRDDVARTCARYDECFDYKQRTQPMADHSAGCIFKNPPGKSAGALIDRVGLKGVSVGRASVSMDHANFIVADTGATADEVLRLIDLVQARVSREVGTDLEVEVDIWRPMLSGAVR